MLMLSLRLSSYLREAPLRSKLIVVFADKSFTVVVFSLENTLEIPSRSVLQRQLGGNPLIWVAMDHLNVTILTNINPVNSA